jgi:lipopolysaccharide assembly protein A
VQIIRTLIWIAVTIVLVAFIAMNWERAPVNIWPLETGYLYFQWPVGVIGLVFFLLGLVPMWLYHRAGKWRLQRRIAALEQSVRAAATPPLATSTQLDALSENKHEDPAA